MFVNISIWPLVAHVRSITEIANTYTRVWSVHHASFAWSVRKPQHFFNQIYDEFRKNIRNHNHFILCAAMRCDGCQLRLCSLFFQHVNLSSDLIHPLFSPASPLLGYVSVGYIFQPDQNTHISKLISFSSIWFGLNQNQIWNTTLLLMLLLLLLLREIVITCARMQSHTSYSIPNYVNNNVICIFVLLEIEITLEIDVLLQWNNVNLCYCSWFLYLLLLSKIPACDQIKCNAMKYLSIW